MKRCCPNCQIELVEIQYRDQILDRCSKCTGLFLDKGELEAISRLVSIAHQVKLEEREIDDIPQPEKDREVSCPADQSPMYPEEIAGSIIDRCPHCEGIWLDGGELAALLLAEKNIRDNLQLYIRLGQ